MTTETITQGWVRLAGETDDASIERYELDSARRALRLIKSALGRERILALVREDVAAGNEVLRAEVQRSAGEQATGTTTLEAGGIGAEEFTTWLSGAFAREDVLIAGHPEHYVIHAEAPGKVHIVETLGSHVCGFFMGGWDEGEVPAAEVDGAAEVRRSRLALDDDGTVIGSVATSFAEAPDGLVATLSVTLPATCAPAMVDQHLEHFAVEFRNWILLGAAELRAGATR